MAARQLAPSSTSSKPRAPVNASLVVKGGSMLIACLPKRLRVIFKKMRDSEDEDRKRRALPRAALVRWPEWQTLETKALKG